MWGRGLETGEGLFRALEAPEEEAMKITMGSTGEVITMDDVPVRVWKGKTDRGIECVVFVHRLAVARALDQRQFIAELQEKAAPADPTKAIPLRNIL